MVPQSIIEMRDIVNFIGEDFVRPFMAGNELVKASHLFNVRLKRGSSSTEFHGLCLAMSNIAGAPHQLRLTISNSRVSIKYMNPSGNVMHATFSK
jgi:hypothetical protein